MIFHFIITKHGSLLTGLLLFMLFITPLEIHENKYRPNASGNVRITGDSLVLAGNLRSSLLYALPIPGSLSVRSRYDHLQKGCIHYVEGRDYVVDYVRGTIARMKGSRIPDFRSNVLYNKKNYSHTDYPEYGNQDYFVFADYTSRNAQLMLERKNASRFLARTARRLRTGGKIIIVGYGDSIISGADSTSSELCFLNRYARYLDEKFPPARIELVNAGIPCATTRDGLAHLNEKVLSAKPDLVIIGFGMNDHNTRGVPPDEYESNLELMVDAIKKSTKSDIILLSCIQPNPEWRFSSHRMSLYHAAIGRVAGTNECAFADIYLLWNNALERKGHPSLLGNNCNHPNDFGHWLYLEALKSLVF